MPRQWNGRITNFRSAILTNATLERIKPRTKRFSLFFFKKYLRKSKWMSMPCEKGSNPGREGFSCFFFSKKETRKSPQWMSMQSENRSNPERAGFSFYLFSCFLWLVLHGKDFSEEKVFPVYFIYKKKSKKVNILNKECGECFVCLLHFSSSVFAVISFLQFFSLFFCVLFSRMCVRRIVRSYSHTHTHTHTHTHAHTHNTHTHTHTHTTKGGRTGKPAGGHQSETHRHISHMRNPHT